METKHYRTCSYSPTVDYAVHLQQPPCDRELDGTFDMESSRILKSITFVGLDNILATTPVYPKLTAVAQRLVETRNLLLQALF